jgi:hypothetical protein
LTGERNKKYLIASIWVIVIGIILWLCGLIIGGMGVIFDIGKWFAAGHIITYDVAIGLVWGGIILFIIGVFGIVTALLKGHLDKGQKKVASASQ